MTVVIVTTTNELSMTNRMPAATECVRRICAAQNQHILTNKGCCNTSKSSRNRPFIRIQIQLQLQISSSNSTFNLNKCYQTRQVRVVMRYTMLLLDLTKCTSATRYRRHRDRSVGRRRYSHSRQSLPGPLFDWRGSTAHAESCLSGHGAPPQTSPRR